MSKFENWERDISNEVIELHEFFQRWFNGTIPISEFSKFTDVLNEKFQLISPRGDLTVRAELINLLKNGYAKNIGIQISVRDVNVEPLSSNVFLAIYTENQILDRKSTSRISSAIFRRNEKLKNNYSWLHVHETWK